MDEYNTTNECEGTFDAFENIVIDITHLIYLNIRSNDVDKHERRCTTEDRKENELSYDENVQLFDKSHPSTFTSSVNTSILPKSFKENSKNYTESLTKETNYMTKFRSVVEEHNKTKAQEVSFDKFENLMIDMNHLIHLKKSSCEVDKHERQCTTGNAKKNEISYDEKYDEIHKLRCNTKENEPVMKVRTDSDCVFPNLTSNEDEEPSQCSKDESFSSHLKRVNSDSSYGTRQRSSTADINKVPENDCRVSESKISELCFDDHEMYESDGSKTFDDALRCFYLHYLLFMLDISLESVREHRRSIEMHEECFKKIDKGIMESSLNYHPDIVQQRGGTENQIKEALKLQTMLNAVMAVLRYLNAAFLADIRTEHQFQYYSKLCLRSLCNEKELKCHINKMKFKLCMISKIKQKNIILEIRNFLIESKKCVSHYIEGEINHFKKLCASVLLQLNHCIEGFRKLCEELEEMEKKCKNENDENMLSIIQNMGNRNKRHLELLNLLEKLAKSSIKGNYAFFSPEEIIDPYFVLPFVCYINVILMCKVMAKSNSVLDFIFENYFFRYRNLNPQKFNHFSELEPLYYLTAYYCGDDRYENKIKPILNNESFSRGWLSRAKCKTEIASKFREILIDVNENMEIRFNTDHYTEVTTADILELEIEKYESMTDEFEKQKQDLSECIKEFRIKTGKVEEECNDAVQASKDLNSKIDETLETNTKMFATLATNSSKIKELLNARKKSNENSQ